MVVKLYEDMIAGKISESNFNLMMKKAQDEQADLNDRVRHNRELLGDQDKLNRDNQQWQDMIREYADIQELDAETLQKLIREIIVHETIDEDGTRNITAEIHFNLKPLPEPMGDSELTTEYNTHEQAGPLMDCSCDEKTPPPVIC